MYKIGDFHNLDSIGVICRGKSINSLKDYSDNFEYCFLVGRHENSLKSIGSYIKGKKIVQVLNKVAINPIKEIMVEYGIQDIQLNFNSKQDTEDVGGNKLKLLEKVKSINKWAQVRLAPAGIKSRKVVKSWATTGLFGVDLAAYHHPKNVYIFGLDFYIADYFCIERKQIENSSKRSKEMIKNLHLICRRDKDINFTIYTCHHSLKDLDNLRVVHV